MKHLNPQKSGSAPQQFAQEQLRASTRRHFFAECGVGLGALALGSMLADESQAAGRLTSDPLAPRQPHFPPRAKRVIFLFMAGGPSQLELFDHKPKLQELDGQVVPASFTKNKRFAFIKGDAKLLGTKRKFARHGGSGAELSELLPHLAEVV